MNNPGPPKGKTSPKHTRRKRKAEWPVQHGERGGHVCCGRFEVFGEWGMRRGNLAEGGGSFGLHFTTIRILAIAFAPASIITWSRGPMALGHVVSRGLPWSGQPQREFHQVSYLPY